MRTFKANQRKANNHRASGRRIAQEIEIIRAALKRRGYRIRKQPKQAAWAVYVTDDKFYLLTYQPAPISAWVLHPQDNDSTRATLSNLIQRALTKQPAGNTRRNS
ncbi:hypothetical protein [Allocoleopsis franciscana]|uniref:Uncharacterized protein n=1 Tax=Allocoleopsis franciscana PCC 7113 TaxID=1173027 RepID=K9WEU2_9CYAN|nr:hypothetical protein [Allocoleopsis franciscana]AFZ18925.1 hypothetical protein Mic7113_3185 [Allocoleopsis franciscana PCC 7113]